MKQLTLETILRVVFGVRGEREAAELRDAVHGTLDTVRSMPRMLAMSLVQRDLGPRSPWGRFRLAVERFDSLLLDVLARSRADPGDDSMLAVLLEQRDEDGNPPSDRHLRDQLVALLVAGHDTSAASLSWAFERIARHPHVQARLRDGEPAYLDAVVKEVLRVRPALTIAPRRLLEPVELAGRRLPAGVHVAACLWLAMRRDDLWPEARRAFKPERWLDGGARYPASWIPFGGGVRRCAGAPFAEMEMREVLRAAAALDLRPSVPEPERARRSALVVTPNRGGEIVVARRRTRRRSHVANARVEDVAHEAHAALLEGRPGGRHVLDVQSQVIRVRLEVADAHPLGVHHAQRDRARLELGEVPLGLYIELGRPSVVP